jgi:hypothetical protein
LAYVVVGLEFTVRLLVPKPFASVRTAGLTPPALLEQVVSDHAEQHKKAFIGHPSAIFVVTGVPDT